RPGAACRDCAGDRDRSNPVAVRRADRRPRSQSGRRNPRAAAGAQSRSRQDDCDGDARSARSRARSANRPPRKGCVDGGRGMKFLPLVWRNLLRRKVRTTFTLLSIFVAFLLYAFLMTIRTAFSMGVEVAGVDRLMMMHKVSLIQLLPISYMRDIQSTPGVRLVSHNTWFGGT